MKPENNPLILSSPGTGFRKRPSQINHSNTYSTGFPRKLEVELAEVSKEPRISWDKKVAFMRSHIEDPDKAAFLESFPGVQKAIYELRFAAIRSSKDIGKQIKDLHELLLDALEAFERSYKLRFGNHGSVFVISNCWTEDLPKPKRDDIKSFEYAMRLIGDIDAIEALNLLAHTKVVNMDDGMDCAGMADDYRWTDLDSLLDIDEVAKTAVHETGHQELHSSYPVVVDLVKSDRKLDLSYKKSEDYVAPYPGHLLHELYAELVELVFNIKCFSPGIVKKPEIKAGLQEIEKKLELLGSPKARGTLTPEGKTLFNQMKASFGNIAQLVKQL